MYYFLKFFFFQEADTTVHNCRKTENLKAHKNQSLIFKRKIHLPHNLFVKRKKKKFFFLFPSLICIPTGINISPWAKYTAFYGDLYSLEITGCTMRQCPISLVCTASNFYVIPEFHRLGEKTECVHWFQETNAAIWYSMLFGVAMGTILQMLRQ